MKKYNPQQIERKWQKIWEQKKIFNVKVNPKKEKEYILVEFPYPSGDGLHVGHCRSYTALDIIARKKRMQGKNVLFPMGWDAFGLPTENYAIKHKIHPSVATKKNTDTFRKQLKRLGFSFNWSREINTTDPAYYKWTQWIFLQLFKHGLAYKDKIAINWCPSCKIGLANEEVVAGNCERCGAKVEKKEKDQWMIKITKYAERLIKDLDNVNYLEKIKIQQKEWIGRSEGALLKFEIRNSKSETNSNSKNSKSKPLTNSHELVNDEIEVFTTRPDTLFGCTFLVMAPEHDLLEKIKNKIENWQEVQNYILQAKNKSDIERQDLQKNKTGVEIRGIKAINPANKKEIPIFVADYVTINYGTGAIMSVPAHDERDFEFAKKYNLEIKMVICPNYPSPVCPVLKEAYDGDGYLVDSGQFDGLNSDEAKDKIIEFVGGKKSVNYKLRDWVFSRQHYWGEPIPLIFCPACKKQAEIRNSKSEIRNLGWVAVTEKDLPVELPKVKNYKPTDTGESPLSAIEKWVNTKCPKCKGPAKRETDTMPNWAGSNWYFLAYTAPKISNFKFQISNSAKNFSQWMPVDWYNGGMEHTTLHLLYSRFIFKFLWDIGAVPKKIGSEPYKKRTSHGMVLGQGGIKMSKSKGNVINPDQVVKDFGADTLRIYEMFMGPFDQAIPWDTKGVVGCRRFLDRIYNLAIKFSLTNSHELVSRELDALVAKTIKKVSEDIEVMRFNTAVSALMILVNAFSDPTSSSGLRGTRESIKSLLLLLSPFAPHLTEELWETMKFKGLCCQQKWPEYDAKLITPERVLIIIQINGKVRDKIFANAGYSQKEVEELAMKSEKIKAHLDGKEIRKIIYVPNKLINFVV